jgi:large subunit ribosomal protein L23
VKSGSVPSFNAEALVLKRPIITEKAMILEQDNKYVFRVTSDANKASVRQAVERAFHVKVDKINMAHVQGKNKSFRGIKGHQSGFKKAVVTLTKGEKIEIIPK